MKNTRTVFYIPPKKNYEDIIPLYILNIIEYIKFSYFQPLLDYLIFFKTWNARNVIVETTTERQTK